MKNIFSVIHNVDIEITFMKYVQSLMHPQLFCCGLYFQNLDFIKETPVSASLCVCLSSPGFAICKKLLFLWS